MTYNTLKNLLKERDIRKDEIIVKNKNGTYRIVRPEQIIDYISNGIVSSVATDGKYSYVVVEITPEARIWSRE